MKAGKIWGQTELIHANGVLEFHRIEFKKGFKCSEHEHKFKWNGFFVESGKMIVRVWQDDQEGLVDETILKPGDGHFRNVSFDTIDNIVNDVKPKCKLSVLFDAWRYNTINLPLRVESNVDLVRIVTYMDNDKLLYAINQAKLVMDFCTIDII